MDRTPDCDSVELNGRTRIATVTDDVSTVDDDVEGLLGVCRVLLLGVQNSDEMDGARGDAASRCCKGEAAAEYNDTFD